MKSKQEIIKVRANINESQNRKIEKIRNKRKESFLPLLHSILLVVSPSGGKREKERRIHIAC